MNRNPIHLALSGLLQLFYPKICVACNVELKGSEETLCLSCVTRLPKTFYHKVADNKCYQNFTGRVPIIQATSFVYFTKSGMIQHLLHQLKYKGKKEIGICLGRIFGAELQKNSWTNTIDGIIAVPLHRKKEMQRGYNQTELFVRGIAEVTGIPVLTGVLIRAKSNETQTNKTRAERIENVREVFALKSPDRIEGKHILLVDDVLTTGATLEACALELMKAGNVRISIATMAIAMD